MRFKITKSKAPIAANSRTIGKIGNARIDDFGLIAASYDLISASLWDGDTQFGHKRILHRLCPCWLMVK